MDNIRKTNILSREGGEWIFFQISHTRRAWKPHYAEPKVLGRMDMLKHY
jgi:hypothetical protein